MRDKVDVRGDAAPAKQIVETRELQVFSRDLQQAARHEVVHERYRVGTRDTQPVEAQHRCSRPDPQLLGDLRRAQGLFEIQDAGSRFPARLLEIVVKAGQSNHPPDGFRRDHRTDPPPPDEQSLFYQLS